MVSFLAENQKVIHFGEIRKYDEETDYVEKKTLRLDIQALL